MERQFIIGDFNTYEDWSLILTDKEINPPQLKTSYVSLDGADGSLDLTEALSGCPTYEDRTVKAMFWTCEGTREDRTAILQKIVNNLHGRKLKIIEPDDPDHYFYGRVSISEIINLLPYSSFTLEATCDPWRYALYDTVKKIALTSAAKDVIFYNNGAKTLCPNINVNGSVSIVIDDVTTNLATGTYKISDLKLSPGVTVIKVSGMGTVTFTYREGDL